MVAFFFLSPKQVNSASTPTSSHQTSLFHSNPPELQIIQHGGQYGEARRFNQLDSAKAALPADLAYEEVKKSAVMNEQRKRKRKKKKFGAIECEGVLPEETLVEEEKVEKPEDTSSEQMKALVKYLKIWSEEPDASDEEQASSKDDLMTVRDEAPVSQPEVKDVEACNVLPSQVLKFPWWQTLSPAL